jgi:hypothetical protein
MDLPWYVEAPTFAAVLDAGGCWSLIAPIVGELSGRFGVRRLIRLPVPMIVKRGRPVRVPETVERLL